MRLFFIFLLTMMCYSSTVLGKELLPDSLVSVENTYLFCLSDPEKAQRIMDELWRRKQGKEWELYWCQGDLYYNTGRYKLAAHFFEQAKEHEEVKKSKQLSMDILSTMTECYRMNNNIDQAMLCAGELLALAKELGNAAEVGRAYMFMGEVVQRQNDLKQAGEFFTLAEKAFKESGQYYYLFHFYLTWANMLQENGQNQKALVKVKRADKALEMVSDEGMPEGYIDFQRGLLDALTADVLVRCGRESEAKQMFDRFMRSPCARDSRGKIHIVPYLLAINEHNKAIDIVAERMEVLRNETDTIGDDMLAAKRYMATAYKQKGDMRNALEHTARLAELLELLRANDQKEAAAELATLYGVQEKERVLAEQQSSLKLHKSILWAVVIILVLCVVVMVVVGYNLRAVRVKNSAMVRQIEDAKLWRERAEGYMAITASAMRDTEVCEDLGDMEDGENVYERLQHLMRTTKLYLNPKITREEVAGMLMVGRRPFIKAVSKYGGGTFLEYVNELRIREAIRLLDNLQGVKTADIAEMAGFGSTRTFFRVFKDKYGMSPGDYRVEKERLLQAQQSKPERDEADDNDEPQLKGE